MYSNDIYFTGLGSKIKINPYCFANTKIKWFAMYISTCIHSLVVCLNYLYAIVSNRRQGTEDTEESTLFDG